MEYVQLGKSDLKVSKICLGCMTFGKSTKVRPWTLNQEETDAMVKRALDLGINSLIQLIPMQKVQAKLS